jgi:hypothetical protein
MFQVLVFDDEVGGKHGGRDLAAVCAVAYEGGHQAGLFRRLFVREKEGRWSAKVRRSKQSASTAPGSLWSSAMLRRKDRRKSTHKGDLDGTTEASSRRFIFLGVAVGVNAGQREVRC